MCTLIVLHRCLPGKPLVVAANRDEFFARPAEDLALRTSKTGPILAPLDLEAGGTWLGLSQRGVFAGLTNLRPLVATEVAKEAVGTGNGAPKDLLSRGEVVMAALEAESADSAMHALMQLEEKAYNPFQLVVADGRDGWLIVYRDTPRAIELTQGVHIVGNVEDEAVASVINAIPEEAVPEEADRKGNENRNQGGSPPEAVDFPGFEGIEGLENLAGLDDSEEPRAVKLVRIRERVEKLMTDSSGDLLEGLAGVCREHVDQTGGKSSPFESTCVHVADRYGTRSSLLLELASETEASRLWTTDGPPCEQSFENRSSLLSSLSVRLRE
ncbi:MAG: NRDE family protein [Myxococcota bacterium]